MTLRDKKNVRLLNDYMLAVPAGRIKGTTSVNKFGSNPEIPLDTTEDIWDGATPYTFPTTADMTHLRQAVDQAAMQGQVVEVQGVDINWDMIVQNITLDASNTTTPVVLETPLLRVARMNVLANVVTDQNIELRNVGGGTTYALIQAGNNQTLMALYPVPRNKIAYITQYYASVTDATNKTPTATEIKLWTADRKNNYEFQLKHAGGIPSQGALPPHEFKPYMQVEEMHDIKMTGEPLDQPAHVHAGFDIILEDM